MGGALLDAGRPAEAIRWYQGVIDARPFDRQAIEGLAAAAVAAGQDDLADLARRRAALLAPDQP